MLAAEKSEFGVCGVVGGMMVIELLAGTMRRGRGGIAAVEDDMSKTYTEGSDPFELIPIDEENGRHDFRSANQYSRPQRRLKRNELSR